MIYLFYAGSKSYVVFAKHFMEGGRFHNTLLGQVLTMNITNESVFDDKQGGVYLDCTEDTLERIINIISTNNNSDMFISQSIHSTIISGGGSNVNNDKDDNIFKSNGGFNDIGETEQMEELLNQLGSEFDSDSDSNHYPQLHQPLSESSLESMSPMSHMSPLPTMLPYQLESKLKKHDQVRTDESNMDELIDELHFNLSGGTNGEVNEEVLESKNNDDNELLEIMNALNERIPHKITKKYIEIN
jgi:hypothetical protein